MSATMPSDWDPNREVPQDEPEERPGSTDEPE